MAKIPPTGPVPRELKLRSPLVVMRSRLEKAAGAAPYKLVLSTIHVEEVPLRFEARVLLNLFEHLKEHEAMIRQDAALDESPPSAHKN